MPGDRRKTALIHMGSAVAQPLLHPVGKQYAVSQPASELLGDFRQAACQFGSSTDAKEIEDHYVAMQMRYAELASYISTIEHYYGVRRDVVLKF